MDKLPYQFHDDRREIRFDRFDLPAPWINYLSGGRMHAFVSQGRNVGDQAVPSAMRRYT